MSKLGNLLKELRGKESLREASKRIGISHTYLDTIEKGHDRRSKNPVKPSPETLKLIAKAYDYPYKSLMITAGYWEENNSDENEEIEPWIMELMKDPEFTHALKDMADDPEERKRQFIEFMRYVKWQEEDKKK